MSADFIKIKGARTNNLKNINIDIPRNKLVVITGLSGSGKSSLAFDTIYAEGQRRYVESLSSYARQFVGLMDKPDIDLIEGLSPAISIDQRTISHNPRSTVGTVTEIYDYLRLLYARAGTPLCPSCHKELKKDFTEVKRTKKVGNRVIKSSTVDRFYSCPLCEYRQAELQPRDFSFNSAHGACLECGGLGEKMEIAKDLIFNNNLSVLEGSIKPLAHVNLNNNPLIKDLLELAERNNLNLRTPLRDFKESEKNILLYGDSINHGIIRYLEDKYVSTKSGTIKAEIEKSMRSTLCSACMGQRLKPETLAVKVDNTSIIELSNKSIDELKAFLSSWLNNKNIFNGNFKIVEPILNEVIKNLELLENVGLSYLTLSRAAATLSGGEAQRIRLASQVGSCLSGVLYVLDEPSIGLHQKDNDKLIKTLQDLRDNGNTVIVVEHDEAMMLSADYLIDIGPGAGENGGEVLFSGTPKQIMKSAKSLTGNYLSGKKTIKTPKKYRVGNNKSLQIIGASEHNLKNIDIDIPLGKLVSITGVSGSGKSTLTNDILAKALSKKFHRAKAEPGKYRKIIGLENLNKVIDIDQSPIGKTPRSNPATYTGVFSYIRDLFAQTDQAKAKKFGPGHFSFNVPGGRCENCGGDGSIKVEMQFLTDIFISCDLCLGKRFKEEILEIKYKNKNIFEVLEMTVSEALRFFAFESPIAKKLKTLEDVGLGYIRLGQSATTFSGGEAQRIKLASELSRRATGKTLYILDEPTTGLHFDDIVRLLKVLNMLVDCGNTVLIIEHNLDVIKSSDYIIDLGPEGGERGGYKIAEGNPKLISSNTKSLTGKYLKKIS